jgi:hypothetical protein
VYSGRESSSYSTSGIRGDGDSGLLEGYVVPAPLVALVVKVPQVATSGAGTIFLSKISESPSRRMPLVEQELCTLPEYLSHHHNECHWLSRSCFPFQNTRATITTNATSGAGTTYPSRIPESPSRRMPLVEQELLTLPEYPSHLHEECL